MKTLSTCVVLAALILGLAGCIAVPTKYTLGFSCAAGGEVTT